MLPIPQFFLSKFILQTYQGKIFQPSIPRFSWSKGLTQATEMMGAVQRGAYRPYNALLHPPKRRITEDIASMSKVLQKISNQRSKVEAGVECQCPPKVLRDH
uniref:Uncharacterized protein n=1 Tax=Cryptomonas curvata TaxID=233186 RepID=A0A7S0QHF4_9CRYP|mmetsp:Transcript_23636/g.49455  ORF Transcript_23636/g.49455 Transcript_23636/m.49455 type:complete len:102 (+) Transcript_23636:84-389(+)